MAVSRAHWRLDDWLRWQERLHPRQVALGVDRIRAVAQRLRLLSAPPVTLTVAGTNGKGASATLAARIYAAAGYRVGLYTSPHLLRYNERVEIDGAPASDVELCQAFAVIDAARADIPLTYFEFGTLAALWLFRHRSVDVQVLEVGLGGRLDAVNVIDADCALLTNVGLDHTAWLGPDRESIGREKAGVFRHGKPAVCVDPEPPASVLQSAEATGARLRRLGRDFGYDRDEDRWSWWSLEQRYAALPWPVLAGEIQLRNAAGVFTAVQALQPLRPVAEVAVRQALSRWRLPGRLQVCGDLLLDVAHNAEAAEVLADHLRTLGPAAPGQLVLGMLADKPVEAVGARLAPLFSSIYAAGLSASPRGLSGLDLKSRLAGVGIEVQAFEDVAAAVAAARCRPSSDRPILVCGSFLTVAAALSMT